MEPEEGSSDNKEMRGLISFSVRGRNEYRFDFQDGSLIIRRFGDHWVVCIEQPGDGNYRDCLEGGDLAALISSKIPCHIEYKSLIEQVEAAFNVKICSDYGTIKVFGPAPYGGYDYKVIYYGDKQEWHLERLPRKPNQEPLSLRVYQGNLSVRVIRDNLFNKKVFIINGETTKVITYDDKEQAIEEFIRKDENITDVENAPILLRILFKEAKKEMGYVKGGFYPEGYFEGIEPYPAINWECRPGALVDFIKYVNENYPVTNRIYVLANTALTMAKVFTPAIRLSNKRVFEDRMMINVGEKGIGKTTMMESIINLLGLDPEKTLVSSDTSLKTPERIRNLLNDTNAPLFIDDPGEDTFEAMKNIILPATVMGAIIGVQAARYGYGLEHKFKSLRSVIISTNLGIGDIKKLLTSHGNTAWTRRVILLQWDGTAKLRPGVTPFNNGSILGCLIDMWRDDNFRSIVIDKLTNLFDIAKFIITQFGLKEDLEPYLKAIDYIKNETKRVENEIDMTESNERKVISRIYEIIRKLGYTNVSVSTIIESMVNNPTAYDIKLSSGRDNDVDYMSEWRRLVNELGYNAEILENTGDIKELKNEYEKALFIALNLIRNGTPKVIILGNSKDGILQNAPKKLFGVERSRYEIRVGDKKIERPGYSITWTTLLRSLINSELENDKNEESNDKNEGSHE